MNNKNRIISICLQLKRSNKNLDYREFTATIESQVTLQVTSPRSCTNNSVIPYLTLPASSGEGADAGCCQRMSSYKAAKRNKKANKRKSVCHSSILCFFFLPMNLGSTTLPLATLPPPIQHLAYVSQSLALLITTPNLLLHIKMLDKHNLEHSLNTKQGFIARTPILL